MKLKKILYYIVILYSTNILNSYKNLRYRMQPLLKPEIDLAYNYANATITCSSISDGFNLKKNKQKLGPLLFGPKIQIKDIYLASKLASEGFFTLPGSPYGDKPSEQFIACLSNTSLNFYCHEKSNYLELMYSHKFRLPKENSYLNTAFILPIEHHQRDMGFTLCSGVLLCELPFNGTFAPINTLYQFFLNFNDINSFILNEVFCKKGLKFSPYQEKISLGDLILDFNYEKLINRELCLQTGLAIIAPTGTKPTATKLWEITTSNNSAITYLYGFVGIGTPLNMFNFYFDLDLGIKWQTTIPMRVPKTKNHASQLFYPELFKDYTILPFKDYDTNIPEFSDSITQIKSEKILLGKFAAGNIWQNAFYKDISILIQYEVSFFQKQNYCLAESLPSNTNINLESIANKSPRSIQDFYAGIFIESQDGQTKGFLGAKTSISGSNYPRTNSINFGIDVYF